MISRADLMARWSRSVQEIGHLATCVLALDRLLRAVSRGHARLVVYVLIAQPVGIAMGTPMRASSKTEVREVGPGDPILQLVPRPANTLSARFLAGGTCLASTVNARFAGMLWYVPGSYEEDEVRCTYRMARPDLSWDYDLHIEPAYRGTRVFARLWQFYAHKLREQGIAWSLSRIALHKTESLAAHARMGSQRIGTACFWVVGSAQLALFSQAPYVHLSLSAQRRPELLLGRTLQTTPAGDRP